MPNQPSPTPVLVKDINAVSAASSPSSLILFNDTLVLFGDDGLHGSELLLLDGLGHTTLVKDLQPGALGSGGKLLTQVRNELFFFASGASEGLWKTDGTEAGTTLVTPLHFYVREFNSSRTVAASGGLFYFMGYDDLHRFNLWRSDGTAEGTHQINVRNPPLFGIYPFDLTDSNGTLFCTMYNAARGVELYRTNGTDLVIVRDINKFAVSSDPQQLVNLNGTLYFTADNGVHGRELWKSSGPFNKVSTMMVRDLNKAPGISSQPKNLTILNDKLYFFADSGKGYQLWTTDGTRAGTVRVSKKVFVEGASGLSDFGLVNSAGRLYFFNRGPKSIELWQTDGLTIGKVADCPDTVAYGVPGTTVDGRFYFNAFDSGTGEELWSSDGTQAGTGLVRDLVPGTRGSMPRELTAFNHHLIGVADTDGLYQTGGVLWQSDGTPAGTIPLELNPTTLGSVIQELTVFQDRLYFSAYDSLFGQELWCSDGSSAGTQLVHDIASWGSSEPRELTVMGNQLFFFASGDAGYGLFRSDGTSASGSLIQLSHSSALSQLVATENRLFFSDFTENGRELWTSDGTVKGTKVIQDINPGVSGSEPWFFDDAAIGNVMYFTADHATYGRELWRTDGTRKGTRLVRDLAAGAQGSNPDHLFVFAGALYFSADDGVRGRELWRTDGVKTTLVKDLAKGYPGSAPENLTLFQDSLHFTTRGFSGVQLWTTNGTAASTIKVVDLPTLAGAYQLTVVHDQIFFVGNNNQLWSTDGTPQGTRLLLEAPTIGSEAGAIDHLTSANGHLYFTTRDSAAGQEVWRSDGTPQGTARVTDLNPHGDSNPTNLTYDATSNKLYFTANDWLHGANECFAINLNQPITDLQLSTVDLDEDLQADSIIGWFLWLGVDPTKLTFQLVSGPGDADNHVFAIEDFGLRIKTKPDYETQPSYSIRVRVTTSDSSSFERIFSLEFNDIHEMSGTSNRDVLTSSPLRDDLQGLDDRDVFNVRADHLDRGDRLDGGKGFDRLRLIGSTLAEGIHIDLSAENQYQFLEGIVYLPEGPPTVIRGMEGINLSKFGARGVLSGSAGRNRLVGSPHPDILTGNGGIDTFGLQALKDSTLSGIDRITDFGRDDRLMAPIPGTTLTAVAGEATELSAAAIGEVLTAAVFTPNSAQAFTVAGQSGVYIGFNDGVAGFDESSDGVLHLSSYTISALDPVVIL